MQWLLLGVGLVVGLGVTLKWASEADPARVRKGLFVIAVVVVLGAVAVLAASGRLGGAMAALAALVPLAMRAMRFHRLFSGLARLLGLVGGQAGAAAGGGRQSEVSTAFLAMRLDHDSGAMTGTVRTGRFAGCELDTLSPEDLRALYAECAGDRESVQVLEAYLDRRADTRDWRQTAHGAGAGGQEQAGPSAAGPMDREEAYRILGLAPGAGPEEIKRAYQQLMVKLHPDHGGSDYLAAKINQAKDTLLGS